MLRRHIVLLIAIHQSDGDVKPGGPLCAFQEEQAMSRHRVSPSPFLSSSSHTTQLHYTNSYTYSHPNLNFVEYTIQILIVCPSGAWFKYRPHLMPSMRLAWNPKRVIVQWVGIGTHTHTHTHKHTHWAWAIKHLWKKNHSQSLLTSLSNMEISKFSKTRSQCPLNAFNMPSRCDTIMSRRYSHSCQTFCSMTCVMLSMAWMCLINSYRVCGSGGM